MVCSQMLAASRDVGRTSHGGNDNRWNRRLPLLSGSVLGTKASRPQSGCASVNAANANQDLHS
jgi:hypothetical protein